MEIGTGVAFVGTSSAVILGIVAILFRLFPRKNNPNSKFLLTERFVEYKEGTNAQLVTLTKAVSEIKDSVKRVHSRIDEMLRGK